MRKKGVRKNQTKTAAKNVEIKTTETKTPEVIEAEANAAEMEQEVSASGENAAEAAEEHAAAETVIEEALAEEKTTKAVKAAKTTKSAKTTTKKAVKEELKPEVFIQYQGKEAVVADAIEKAKAEFVADGHRVSTIKTLQVYLKPEDNSAYYVINQKFAGRVDLF